MKMNTGPVFMAEKSVRRRFWRDMHGQLFQAVQATLVFAICILLIFLIEDWFSSREIFWQLFLAKLSSICVMLAILAALKTRYGKKYIVFLFMLGTCSILFSVNYLSIQTGETFMVPIAVIIISIVSAIMSPYRLLYHILIVLLCISAIFINLLYLQGFPPLLPLGRETIAGIVFPLSTVLLHLYSNNQRFRLWKSENELRQKQEQFNHVTEYSNDIIWIWTPDRKVEYISPSYEYYTGKPADKVYKNSLMVLRMVEADDRKEFAKALEDIIQGKTRKMDLRVKHTDGTLYHLEGWGSAIKNQEGEVVRCIGIWRDITSRVKLIQQLDRIAITDPLTKIYNRRYFNQRAQEEISRIKRSGKPLSLILFDIDFFKKVNDTYGHQAGDKVLVDIVRLCQGELRSQDIFARYGGEEFVILLPETDTRHALNIAERLRKIVETTPVLYDGTEITITVSIGIASSEPSEINSIEEILNSADEALYQSKQTGRNRITTVAA